MKKEVAFASVKTPVKEHALNISKAILSSFPVGSGIASLLTDYIPSSKFIRLEEFSKQIANDFETLKDRIDDSQILTDEFAFVFEKCLRGVSENYQQEKLEAFRGILLNSAIDEDFSQEEKEYFLNLASSLSVLHIRILKFMAAPVKYLNDAGIPQNDIRGGFSDFFPRVIAGVSLDAIKLAFGELYAYGMISTDKSIFHTMTSGQGLSLLGDRCTNFGRRFIEFCTVPV